MCLCDKFIFMGGVPVFRNIVAATICHVQNRMCFSPGHLNSLESSLSISQRSFIISTTFPSTSETWSGNCKRIRMSNYEVWSSSTRDAYYNLFSRITFQQKNRVLLSLPFACNWVSIKLAEQFIVPAFERKVWSYKIKQRSHFLFVFRTDRKWLNKTCRPKNVFVFAKVALVKLSRSNDCQPQNLLNITTWLQR